MSSLVQSGSVRYYMGWYGNCANDPQSPTGGCEPFDLVSEPRIRLVWEISDGIKAFSSASPSFSPIQQLEAGKCYMIAINPGDGVIDLPHLVLSGEGGYVGQSCALALNFVTVNAYTRPNTSEIDYGYGYYPVQYAPGDTVTLTAKTRENYEFKEWSFFSPSSIWADITDATSSTITFTMPSEPVTVSAEYMDLTLDSDGDGIPDHLDPYPNQSPQAINWADTDLTLLVVGDTAELKATAETDITYTISDTSVATISGSTITIVGDGTAEVTATAPANSQYFGATATISFQTDADSDGDGIPDSQDTEPYQQAQLITWNDDLSALSVGDVVTLTASAQTSVTYTSSDASILSVSGNTATAVSPGVATLTATAASTSDYFTATSTISASISEVSSDSEDAHLYWDGTYLVVEFTAVDETQNYQLLSTVDNAYSPPDPSGIGVLSGVELYPEHTLWENDNSTGAAYNWSRNALDNGYERWSVAINTADIYSDWTVLLPRLVHPVRGEIDFQLGGLFAGTQPDLLNGYAIEDTNAYSLDPFPIWKPKVNVHINGALGPNFLGADINLDGGDSMASAEYEAGDTVLVNVTPPDGQVLTSIWWSGGGVDVYFQQVSAGVWSLTVPAGQYYITINATFEVDEVHYPTFDDYTDVVKSPAQVEMPSDGSVPQTDVNGDPLFKWYPDENDASRFGFDYFNNGVDEKIQLWNYSNNNLKFVKAGTINVIYSDSSGNVFDAPLDTLGTYHSELDDNEANVSASTGFAVLTLNSGINMAELHGIYGDFAIYFEHSSGYIYIPTSYGPSKSTMIVKQGGLTFQEEAYSNGGLSAARFGPLNPGEYQLGYIPDNDANGDPYQFTSLNFAIWNEGYHVPDPYEWFVSEADTSGTTSFGPGAIVFGSGDTKLIFKGDVSAALT